MATTRRKLPSGCCTICEELTTVAVTRSVAVWPADCASTGAATSSASNSTVNFTGADTRIPFTLHIGSGGRGHQPQLAHFGNQRGSARITLNILMRHIGLVVMLAAALALPGVAQTAEKTDTLNGASVDRFAGLALACAQKEYPNKISHSMLSDADARPPRELTPAFYGCFDWHSSVHGHWLLARLLRQYPGAAFAERARAVLRQDLSAANLATEAAYIARSDRSAFERPYGMAWMLQLAAELREWDDPEGRELAANMQPLEKAAVERLTRWLNKLPFPVRTGEHSQTAFGLGLMLDYARVSGNHEFAALLESKARQFYLKDRACPLNYEPGGEDFLSPCLAEADVMRRVLPPAEYATWLAEFLPVIPRDGRAGWIAPAVSPDPTDGKLAHLDGLNLSRAWMLHGIASGLPKTDLRRKAIAAAAEAHAQRGLAAVTGEHYEGGHWLGSFAVYLVTHRGY